MKTLNLTMLFQQLIHYRNQTTGSQQLGPWLEQQLKNSHFPNLSHLPFSPAGYTRNSVAKELDMVECPTNNLTETAFEALVMRWDKQVKTSVHGHPKFSFYYVVSGVYEIDCFVRSPEGIQIAKTQRFQAADTTWFLGQSKRYDNWIHRVRCLEAGLTFHIYSDDAQKGVVF